MYRFKKAIKKRYPDSHRSTVTTQTQNKTRQNYYAIIPVNAGEAIGYYFYEYSHIHKALQDDLHYINISII